MLDFIIIIVIVGAVIKGMRRGFIIALLSVFAIMVGLAAAIKLSAVVASHLSGGQSKWWLPLVSFIIVFTCAALLVRWMALLMTRVVDVTGLGLANKLAGAALYVALYMAVLSIILFYAAQTHIISAATAQKSLLYGMIEPWGPACINVMGSALPFFANMFHQLEHFFSGYAT